MKRFAYTLLTITLLTGAGSAAAYGNVIVSSPHAGDTVSTTTALFEATANTTTCSKGVASMGVYVDNRLEYVVQGTTLNTSLPLAAGKHDAVLQEWDYCGGSTKMAVPITAAVESAVWVSVPANNSTTSALTSYVATATSGCEAGVAAMGIYVNNQLMYVTPGAKLNTQLSLEPGAQQTVVQEWDNCGGAAKTPVALTVAETGKTFSNLQRSSGWKSSGQVYPNYSDCDTSCPGVTFSMKQGVASPSLSGNATQWNLGGTTPYSDVLFYNQLIGTASTQGLPDFGHTLVPSLHDFTYDLWFYVTDAAHTQAMEFDINWFMNSVGITWGTECRMEGGNEWDVWDNVAAHWEPTGFACHPLANAWNHVTVVAQRGEGNTVIYKSITLNGVTNTINKTYQPFWVPASWYGITVNYQMDGDQKQTAITSYADNVSFTYQ
jgi:hypothetical protein